MAYCFLFYKMEGSRGLMGNKTLYMHFWQGAMVLSQQTDKWQISWDMHQSVHFYMIVLYGIIQCYVIIYTVVYS